MARELAIRITANNADAMAKLGQTEKGITGIQEKATGATGVVGKMGAAFSGAAGSLARFIGPASIGLAIQQFTSLGGSIQDTADKLGVSTDAIQKWTFAAEQNGSTLASVTSAALFLYRQLAEGDKSTVAGLEALGLTLEDVKALKPEQAFEVIADRIGKMKDPIAQVALGAALMGRGFADVLPAAQQGFGVLGDKAAELGLVMDQTAIKAAEEFGNSINQLKTGVMALIGSALGPFIPVLNALLQALLPIIQRLAELLNVVLTPLAWVITKVAQGLEWLIKTCLDLFHPIKIVREQWAIFLDFFEKSKKIIVDTAKAIYEGVTYWFVDRFADTVKGVKGLVGVVNDVYKQLWLNVVGKSYVPDMINGIAKEFARLSTVMVKPAVDATKKTGNSFEAWAETSTQAFQAMSSVGGASFSRIASSATTAVVALKAYTAAATAAAAAMGAVTIVGAVAGFAQQLQASLSKPNKMKLAVDELVASIERLGHTAAFTRANMTGLTSGVVGLERNMGLTNRGMRLFLEFQLKLAQEGAFPWEKMEEAAKKYNIAIEDLGGQFSQAKFIAPLREMVTEWRLLVENGANANAVALGMKDHLQAAILEAIKFGHALPAGLKEPIQRLIDMGLLLDQNGEQMRNIEQLTWVTTIEESLQSLVETFKDLVELMKGPVAAEFGLLGRHGRLAGEEARRGWIWGSTQPGAGGGGGWFGGNGGGAGGGFFGGLAEPAPAMASTPGGAVNVTLNNPQFSDRASVDELTRRVGRSLMADLTGRVRFAQ